MIFFLFCGGCEGYSKLPRPFLSDELPLNEDFFKIGISEEKSEDRLENQNEAIFQEKFGMNGSLIIYQARKQGQKQSSAKSWPKLKKHVI